MPSSHAAPGDADGQKETDDLRATSCAAEPASGECVFLVLLVVLVAGLVVGVGEAGVDGVVQVEVLAVPGGDDGVRGDLGVVAVPDGPAGLWEGGTGWEGMIGSQGTQADIVNVSKNQIKA